MMETPDTRNFSWTSQSKIGRLFALLSDNKLHAAKELASISHRFGGYLQTIRKAGYEIETTRLYGYWAYCMTGRRINYQAEHHSCPTCTCFEGAA